MCLKEQLKSTSTLQTVFESADSLPIDVEVVPQIYQYMIYIIYNIYIIYHTHTIFVCVLHVLPLNIDICIL